MLDSKVKLVIIYSVVFLALLAPLFLNLGSKPLRVWDESRNAVNAQEMINDGDFIVPHFRGKPEMWNTKPPLVIWGQVLSMKLFGMNEFAIRLPSALAGLATCLLLLWFGRTFLNSDIIGILSALVLVSTNGYISYHVTRTGDLDAILTLFTTASLLFLFAYTETKSKRYLQFFFTSVAMAVLSKSIVFFLFVPGVMIYLIVIKKLKSLVLDKQFYLNSYLFLAPVLGYYLIREHYNPGYLSAVYNNEIMGRFLTAIENHTQSVWYYFQNLFNARFSYWIWFALASAIATPFVYKGNLKRLSVFLSICVLTFLIVLSTAKSKIQWYDAPIYPMLALHIALFITYIRQYVESKLNTNKSKKWLVPVSLLILISCYPYVTIIQKVANTEELKHEQSFYEIEYFLRDNETMISKMTAPKVVYSGYDVQVEFYVNRLRSYGSHIELIPSQKVGVGKELIICQKEVLVELKHQYHFEIIQEFGFVTIGKINGLKVR